MHVNLEAERGLRHAVDKLNSFVRDLRTNYERSDDRLATDTHQRQP